MPKTAPLPSRLCKLLLLLILALNAAAFGQSAPDIHRLRQFLNLSDAQFQQLTDNFNQYSIIAGQAYDRMDRLYGEIVEAQDVLLIDGDPVYFGGYSSPASANFTRDAG